MGCIFSKSNTTEPHDTTESNERDGGRGPSSSSAQENREQRSIKSTRSVGSMRSSTIASQTNFSVSEVDSLRELYQKLSNELHHDGLIHKDELAWALFKCHRDNLFVDRVFELFDIKNNNVIDFGEFVTSLSVFHPNAPLEEKAKFAFRIYDINQSGAIEPPELKRFLVAIMADNPDVHLDDEALEKIVADTFEQVDVTGDGKIVPEEWMALVKKNPSIISYMTLPVLADICRKFPPSPGKHHSEQRRG